VSEITERLWAEYEGFCKRDLSEHAIVYLFVDDIAERLRPGQRREAVLAAWGIGSDRASQARDCPDLATRSGTPKPGPGKARPEAMTPRTLCAVMIWEAWKHVHKAEAA
jgi:hypothetical protein